MTNLVGKYTTLRDPEGNVIIPRTKAKLVEYNDKNVQEALDDLVLNTSILEETITNCVTLNDLDKMIDSDEFKEKLSDTFVKKVDYDDFAIEVQQAFFDLEDKFDEFKTSDFTGPQGPIGPQGIMGPQGPKGDKGDPGDSAVINANDNIELVTLTFNNEKEIQLDYLENDELVTDYVVLRSELDDLNVEGVESLIEDLEVLQGMVVELDTKVDKFSTDDEIAKTYATKEEHLQLAQDIERSYVTKEELELDINELVDENYYTKEKIDNKLSGISLRNNRQDELIEINKSIITPLLDIVANLSDRITDIETRRILSFLNDDEEEGDYLLPEPGINLEIPIYPEFETGKPKIISTFNEKVIYYSDEDVIVPFKVSSETIVNSLYYTLDGTLNIIDAYEGFNELVLSNLGTGLHNLSLKLINNLEVESDEILLQFTVKENVSAIESFKNLRIANVYGANDEAILINDYIELYNIGEYPINLKGIYLNYTSIDNNWIKLALPDCTLNPYTSFLIYGREHEDGIELPIQDMEWRDDNNDLISISSESYKLTLSTNENEYPKGTVEPHNVDSKILDCVFACSDRDLLDIEPTIVGISNIAAALQITEENWTVVPFMEDDDNLEYLPCNSLVENSYSIRYHAPLLENDILEPTYEELDAIFNSTNPYLLLGIDTISQDFISNIYELCINGKQQEIIYNINGNNYNLFTPQASKGIEFLVPVLFDCTEDSSLINITIKTDKYTNLDVKIQLPECILEDYEYQSHKKDPSDTSFSILTNSDSIIELGYLSSDIDDKPMLINLPIIYDNYIIKTDGDYLLGKDEDDSNYITLSFNKTNESYSKDIKLLFLDDQLHQCNITVKVTCINS